MFLKKLRLQNYCQYEDHTFDFTKPDGSPYKFVCFFGPNGSGKTNALTAMSLLTMNQTGRDQSNVIRSLQKYVMNKNWDPTYSKIAGHSYKNNLIIAGKEKNNEPTMIIEGTYQIDNQQYIVRLTQNGYERDDLTDYAPWRANHLFYRQRISNFTSSDSDLSLSKFQLRKAQAETFEKITSNVMRFPVDCVAPSGFMDFDEEFCTDMVIHKEKGFQIHYKSTSLGEKKITKMFSQILNVIYDLENPQGRNDITLPGWPQLLLIDNIAMHIYFDRHIAVVDCFKKYFNQQVFATTHSGVLIQRFLDGKNDQENEQMIDVEKIN